MIKEKGHVGYRDSITGKYVTKQHAHKYPNTTHKETIPNPGRGDTKPHKKKK